MLAIYRAPNGRTYQYEEGTQPEGYEPLDGAPRKAPAKARAPRNKARTTRKKTSDA